MPLSLHSDFDLIVFLCFFLLSLTHRRAVNIGCSHSVPPCLSSCSQCFASYCIALCFLEDDSFNIMHPFPFVFPIYFSVILSSPDDGILAFAGFLMVQYQLSSQPVSSVNLLIGPRSILSSHIPRYQPCSSTDRSHLYGCHDEQALLHSIVRSPR